jgi:hypothetical protein
MRTMKVNQHELTVEDLDTVTGGGIVDSVLAESEESTAVFLKRFAETSQRVNAFINAAPAASQGQAAEG